MRDSYLVFCRKCLRTLRAAATLAGRRVRCGSCKAVMRLPDVGTLLIEQRMRHLAPGKN
jgi:Probable zinc-ribbon domain